MSANAAALLQGPPPDIVEESKKHYRTEGATAHAAGIARADCPYLPTTLARRFWWEGWDVAALTGTRSF